MNFVIIQLDNKKEIFMSNTIITMKNKFSSWVRPRVMWLRYAYSTWGKTYQSFKERLESLSIMGNPSKPIAIIWVSNYDEDSQLTDSYAMAEYFAYRNDLEPYYNVLFMVSSGNFARDMLSCYMEYGKKASLCLFSAIADKGGILVNREIAQDLFKSLLERDVLQRGIKYLEENAQLIFMISGYLSCQYHISPNWWEAHLGPVRTRDLYGSREVVAMDGEVCRGTTLTCKKGRVSEISFAVK